MRPNKLIVNSFGPYAKTQVFDFTLLDGYSIFLVTGATGAGKTTIFDAICFALYGEASGKSRETDTFKSHYAADDDECWVEFEFSLSNKLYKIFRKPRQTALKRDNSIKEISERAELTYPDGKQISGSKQVDEAIERIIGLNCNQFRQIIMLAQGEFKQLLEAKSDEKQKIFSQIFSTEIFAKITAKLEDKEKNLRNNLSINHEKTSYCINNLINSGHTKIAEFDNAKFTQTQQICTIVEDDINEYQASLFDIKSNLEKYQAELSKIDIPSAITLNKKIIAYNNIYDELYSLQQKNDEFEEKNKSVIDLTHVKELFIHEQAILAVKKSVEQYQQEIDSLEQQIKLATQKLTDAENNKISISNLTEQHNALADKKQNLNALFNVIKQIEQKSDNKKISEEKQQLLNSSLTANRYYFEKLTVATSTVILKQNINTANELIKNITIVLNLETKRKKAENDFNDGYNLFLNGQAYALAKGLKDGLPCPVCGSQNHPHPAKSLLTIPTQAELDSLKQISDNLYKQITELTGKCKVDFSKLTANGELTDIQITFNSSFINMLTCCITDNEQKLNEILALISELDIKIAQLGYAIKNYDFDFINSEYNKLCSEIAVNEQNIRLLISEIDNLNSGISDEFKNITAINKAIEEIDKDLLQVESTINKINEDYNNAKQVYVLTCERLRTTQEHFTASSHDYSERRNDFKVLLSNYSFESYNDYNTLKSKIEELDILKTDVTEYYERVSKLEIQKASLYDDVKDKEIIDVENLQISADNLKEKIKYLSEKQTELNTKIAISKSNLIQLKEISLNNIKLNTEYSAVADLANMAKGNNAQRISFERYILASYFDDIIKMANINLTKMSDARYTLKRKEDRSKRSPSGLDLEIIDSYTGKERSVSTLSGGESFKASLALALGLADIVQMYSGGVSIETMFIDEGFGSLDSHSLEMAINTLMSLNKSGRLVGIISHVPELKERITAKLIIDKSTSGSKAHFEV